MKNFVLGVIFTVAVFIVGALSYLLLGFVEVRGKVPETQLESRFDDRDGSRLSLEARTGAGRSVSSYG